MDSKESNQVDGPGSSTLPTTAGPSSVEHASRVVARDDPNIARVTTKPDEEIYDNDSTSVVSCGQVRGVEEPKPGPLGTFHKLPPEVRNMIWDSLLRFTWPVVLTAPHQLSSHDHHLRLCPINEHKRVGDTLYCTDRFSSTDVIVYRAPRSVLEISLTSKELRLEVLPVFFAINSILSPYPDWLLTCDRGTAHYLAMVRSLTICWYHQKNWILSTLRALPHMPALEKLAIYFDPDGPFFSRTRDVKTTRGMAALSKLRGIKTLKLVGTDRIKDSTGRWQEVDVEHSDAVGPWLREKVTKPKRGLGQCIVFLGITYPHTN
ncbi:MAG: hypothetical protein Q9172_002057 [Xanthocarpia lactea]